MRLEIVIFFLVHAQAYFLYLNESLETHSCTGIIHHCDHFITSNAMAEESLKYPLD